MSPVLMQVTLLLPLVVNGSLLGSPAAREEIQGFVDSYVNGTYGT